MPKIVVNKILPLSPWLERGFGVPQRDSLLAKRAKPRLGAAA